MGFSSEIVFNYSYVIDWAVFYKKLFSNLQQLCGYQVRRPKHLEGSGSARYATVHVQKRQVEYFFPRLVCATVEGDWSRLESFDRSLLSLENYFWLSQRLRGLWNCVSETTRFPSNLIFINSSANDSPVFLEATPKILRSHAHFEA